MNFLNTDFSQLQPHQFPPMPNTETTYNPNSQYPIPNYNTQYQTHNSLIRSQQSFAKQPYNNKQQSNQPPPLEGYEQQTDITHSCLDTEPVKQHSNNVIEHLNLENFKLKQCSINQNHNHKHCPFYHNVKDRKRPGDFYSAELCEYIEKNEQCPYGDNCQKAHNRVEQLYKPDKYKTKFCSYYPQNLNKCDYGAFCSFAHNENDILIELIHNYYYDDDFYMFHFKTVWCPFNLTAHDKSLCVYAHNWQDYRRKPQLYYYEPVACINWKSTDYILNYEEGCKDQQNCYMCHGWKELEYHPLNYKTKPCQNVKNCQKQKDCPNYHYPAEKRTISQGINFFVFKYQPKNRIISGTFKIRQNTLSNWILNSNQQQMGFSGNSTGIEGNNLSCMLNQLNCNYQSQQMQNQQSQLTQSNDFNQFSKRQPYSNQQIRSDQNLYSTEFQLNSLQQNNQQQIDNNNFNIEKVIIDQINNLLLDDINQK